MSEQETRKAAMEAALERALAAQVAEAERLDIEFGEIEQALYGDGFEDGWNTRQHEAADAWKVIRSEADLPKESWFHWVTTKAGVVCLAWFAERKSSWTVPDGGESLDVIAWVSLPGPYYPEAAEQQEI